MLENTRNIHAKPDSNHVPSMLLDVERGQPIEVEVILGEVVRMAKERNVDIPVSIADADNVPIDQCSDLGRPARRDSVCSPPCCAESNSAQDRNWRVLEGGDEDYVCGPFPLLFSVARCPNNCASSDHRPLYRYRLYGVSGFIKDLARINRYITSRHSRDVPLISIPNLCPAL